MILFFKANYQTQHTHAHIYDIYKVCVYNMILFRVYMNANEYSLHLLWKYDPLGCSTKIQYDNIETDVYLHV